jgi:hypothetical protein
MTYAIEFPDFPAADLPAIPADWSDQSWRQDACPCFHIGSLAVFIDYLNPHYSENEFAPRFSVQGIDNCLELFASNDWQAVLDFVQQRRADTARYAARLAKI